MNGVSRPQCHYLGRISGNENEDTDSRAGGDDTVLVLAAPGKRGKRRCRDDQSQHPQVKVGIRPKGDANDGQGDQQERRYQAMDAADHGHRDRYSIQPSSVQLFADSF